MQHAPGIVGLPVNFSNQLEDLVDRLLRQNIVDQVTNEELNGGTLFFLPWGAFRWIALSAKLEDMKVPTDKLRT
jgi:urocanate hydratase